MLYAGVDYHKRYSQVHVIDEHGRTRARARLANDFAGLCDFFAGLGWTIASKSTAVAIWLHAFKQL